MMYRCEAQSAEGFVQQLACNLVNHGYRYYVAAHVPAGKDVYAVDSKLIEGYGLDVSKWVQARRKARGQSKIAYLRCERFFVLIATDGEHVFFKRERWKDIRREPIEFAGYCIASSKGSDGRYHASVKIHPATFQERLSYLLGLAVHRSADALTREFLSLKFTPYARVRRQLLRLLREVNEARRTAGFDPVPLTVLKLRRYPVPVFSSSQDKPLEKAA